jgi:hypothetical protein
VFQNSAEHNNSDTSKSVTFFKIQRKSKKFIRNEVEPREEPGKIISQFSKNSVVSQNFIGPFWPIKKI